MSILVLNAGSSTLKFALFDQSACDELADGLVDWHGRDESATVTFRSPATGDKQSSVIVADYGEAASWILDSLVQNGRVPGDRLSRVSVEFEEDRFDNLPPES